MTDPTLISDTPNLLRSLRMVAVPTDLAVPACPEPRRAAGPSRRERPGSPRRRAVVRRDTRPVSGRRHCAKPEGKRPSDG